MNILTVPTWIHQLVEVLSATIDHPLPIDWVVGYRKGDWRVILHPAIVQTGEGVFKTADICPRLPETLGVFDFGASVTYQGQKRVSITGRFAGNPILVDILSKTPDFARPSFTSSEDGSIIPLNERSRGPALN